MSNYVDIDNLEIKQLKKKISELEIELTKAKKILKDNELSDETSLISDEELICINEIHKLRIASDNGILTFEDVKVLDLLVKNLMVIRGKPFLEEKKVSKKGTKSVAELLSIVDSKK